MPVAAVEIEVSLQAYEQQTQDGEPQTFIFFPLSRCSNDVHDSVIATCKELGIAVVACS